jgi:hypothetical protein
VSFWVSLSISHFLFPLYGYAMNHGGGVVYSRRYPKYSRLNLPWIPLKMWDQNIKMKELGDKAMGKQEKKMRLLFTQGDGQK